MKKLMALVLITLSATAMAQHHHHHHHHRHNGWGYNGWIAPVIVSVIGYEIARRQSPPVIIQQPVVIQPAPYYGQTQVQSCTAWNEIQMPDGRIYRERTCTQ